MEENGNWIKSHRSILNWEWWGDPNMLVVWIFCLHKANHVEKKWRGQTIGVGQFITSIVNASKECKLSQQSWRTCTERLKSTGEITIKTTNRFSLITVNNWQKYQSANTPANTPANKQLTNKQQTNNNNIRSKELKNEEEEKKIEKKFSVNFKMFTSR